jgi:hypothetical protein
VDYDTRKVDDAVLALLHLTTFSDGNILRAWKGHAWEVLNRLHDQGHISDPKTKSKSVVLTEEGVDRSRQLFRQLFGEAV